MAKVLCVIIDGLQTDALKCAHIRCMSKLVTNGVIAPLHHRGPNLTLPALTTLLTSMPPEEHGVLADYFPLPAETCTASLIPLLHYQHLTCSLFYSSKLIGRLFPDECLHSSVFLNSDGIQNMDLKLAEMAARHIQKEKPDLCFLQLQGTDIAGTHFGYLSEPYLESVEQADQALEMVLEQIRLVGLQHDYITMVFSTHAGSWSEERLAVFDDPLLFILHGPGVQENLTLRRGVSFLDLAPTLATLLRIPPHPNWKGDLIQEILMPDDIENVPYSLDDHLLQLHKKNKICSPA